MRAHQPGSTPIDIPETVPNPAHTPAPAPAPERAPTKAPDKVPEKVIAPASFDAFFSDQARDMAHASARQHEQPWAPRLWVFRYFLPVFQVLAGTVQFQRQTHCCSLG